MYIIIFGILILKLQISVSNPQFPRHIDLQKVGEAVFNNEKFNILKPTAHLVTDHFKDFMLRQGSAHPGDRVFIDKNGFRHAWSGFGDKTKSLRKTDQKHLSESFEKISDKTPESGIISKYGNDNDNTAATVEGNNKNENNNQEEANIASGNNETVNHQNLTEEDIETSDSKEMTTIINIPLDAHEINSTKISIEQRSSNKIKVGVRKGDKPKDKTPAKDKGTETGKSKGDKTTKAKDATTVKPKDDKTTKAKDTTKPKVVDLLRLKDDTTAKPNNNKPIGKERTVATTTFFCPFFGVITMSAFID